MKRYSLVFAIAISIVVFVMSKTQATAQRSTVAANSSPAILPAASPETPSAEEIWADLIRGNERFVAGQPEAHNLVSLRNTLSKSQHPKVIVLACSDSRVAPELLFDQSLGDLFVIRSAGNIADPVGLGSIEYAADHLGSSVLVVLGHQKCGAVTAACSQQKMPTTNLQAIVDRINPAVLQVGDSAQGDARIEAAVKQNVHQSAKDVLANSELLQHMAAAGKLTVVEAEYNLETGRVVRLDSGSTH
jgi:carbonic anhydrase